MESSIRFQKSLAVFTKVSEIETLSNEDVSQALHKKEFSEAASRVESVQDFVGNPNNYVVLQDWIPRDQATADRYKRLAKSYFSDKNIKNFINDDEADPHLMSDLALLREAVDMTGFDPNNNYTTTQVRIPQLLLFGTGDGRYVKQLIDEIRPSVISIIVTEWTDWISSFWSVDWLDIWNAYCLDEDKQICAIKVKDSLSLKGYLASFSLPLLDHAVTYCAPSAHSSLKELYSGFKNDELKRAITYFGFTMDEYNMIWNSWKTLQCEPRVFDSLSTPRELKSRYIVCGSGPSLDKNLDLIKRLSDNHIIIACASNYGSLRKAGIRVDILCILERGEFMIDQYRDIVNKYGSGSTRLFTSVTSPAELLEFFNSPMVYFRPAVTPLSLFAQKPSQVLLCEGPQTVNTGVALATTLGGKSVVLFGVDLGTREISVPRSTDAIGESPREFNQEVPANFGGYAWTNSMLIDGQKVLERVASQNSHIQYYNASDGILIEGFEPILPIRYSSRIDEDSELESAHSSSTKRLWSWWDMTPKYRLPDFIAMWKASKPRETVFTTIERLRSILEDSSAWSPSTALRINKLLHPDANQARAAQFAARVIRGHMLKLLLAITRQDLVMQCDPEKQQVFNLSARRILKRRLDQFEEELYLLIDSMEI